MKGIILFTGSSHPELGQLIAQRLSLPLGQLIIRKFANQEIGIEIQQSVRDMDVYILQTAFGDLNDYLMELLILIHACKIASAARVTAVLSCFPYSRHIPWPPERPHRSPLTPRQRQMLELFRSNPTNIQGYRPWAARAGHLVASMIEAAGADHVFAMDLHDPQLQGFFRRPLDNLPVNPLLVRYIVNHISNYKQAVIVSPDAGGAKRATEMANLLGCVFALIHHSKSPCQDKLREHTDNNDEEAVLVGNVQNRVAILVDDMVDTSATLLEAAHLLRRQGATKIYAVISHGIFSADDSIPQLEASEVDEIIVTNTVPQINHLTASTKLRIVDISPILAEAIRRAHNGESISYLFSPQAFI